MGMKKIVWRKKNGSQVEFFCQFEQQWTSVSIVWLSTYVPERSRMESVVFIQSWNSAH